MAITINNSGVTFNDGTSQSTASPFTKSYNSGNLTVPSTTGQTFSVSHGMGVVPKIVEMRGYCHTAVNGFTAGMEFPISVNEVDNGNQQTPGWYANSTTIWYTSGSRMTITRPDNQYGMALQGNSAYFYLKIYAWA